MKSRFIAQHQQGYLEKTMCQAQSRSESGYSAWKRRPPSQRQQADEALAGRMRQVHQAAHRIYGSRRIRAKLVEQGRPCGRKRVVRLMRPTASSSDQHDRQSAH